MKKNETKVIASKENAVAALKKLELLRGGQVEMAFLQSFLESASKRLPSEAAIHKDRTRKAAA